MRACNYCLSLLIKETGGIRPSGISAGLYLNQYSNAEKWEKQQLPNILKPYISIWWVVTGNNQTIGDFQNLINCTALVGHFCEPRILHSLTYKRVRKGGDARPSGREGSCRSERPIHASQGPRPALNPHLVPFPPDPGQHSHHLHLVLLTHLLQVAASRALSSCSGFRCCTGDFTGVVVRAGCQVGIEHATSDPQGVSWGKWAPAYPPFLTFPGHWDHQTWLNILLDCLKYCICQAVLILWKEILSFDLTM